MSPVNDTLQGRVQEVARGPDGRLFLSRGDAFDAHDMFGQPHPEDGALEAL